MVYKIIIKELKCNHCLLFQIFTLPMSVDLCIDWVYRTYVRCKIVLINDKYSFYHAHLQSGKVPVTDKVCETITNYRRLNYNHPPFENHNN